MPAALKRHTNTLKGQIKQAVEQNSHPRNDPEHIVTWRELLVALSYNGKDLGDMDHMALTQPASRTCHPGTNENNRRTSPYGKTWAVCPAKASPQASPRGSPEKNWCYSGGDQRQGDNHRRSSLLHEFQCSYSPPKNWFQQALSLGVYEP